MARAVNMRPGLIVTGLALVLAAALLATPADAASRYKTVIRTFSSAQPIAIPLSDSGIVTAAPHPSEIPVRNLRGARSSRRTSFSRALAASGPRT